MKFKFYYKKIEYKSIYKTQEILTVCSSYNNSKDEKVISGYLTETIEFYDKNDFIKCRKILEGNENDTGMGTESWDQHILGDTVYYSFEFDPDNKNFHAEISRKSMLILLKKWIEFINKEVKDGYEEIWEI